MEDSRKLLGTTFESHVPQSDRVIAGMTRQDQDVSKKGRQGSPKISQKNPKNQSSDYATRLKSPPQRKPQPPPRLEPLRPSYQAYRKEQDIHRQSTQQQSRSSQRTRGISPSVFAFVNNDIVCNCDILEEVEKGEAEKYDKDFQQNQQQKLSLPRLHTLFWNNQVR